MYLGQVTATPAPQESIWDILTGGVKQAVSSELTRRYGDTPSAPTPVATAQFSYTPTPGGIKTDDLIKYAPIAISLVLLAMKFARR